MEVSWKPWWMGEVLLVVTLCTIGQDKIHLHLSPTGSVELPNGSLSWDVATFAEQCCLLSMFRSKYQLKKCLATSKKYVAVHYFC